VPTRRLDIAGRFATPAELKVQFDGEIYAARPGEPLAYTLLAHGVYVLGRSSKYHRPRGMFCGTGSCGQCVARVGGLPSVRTCLAPATAGLEARAQNVLGSARFDLLAPIDWIFFAGLDHHRLMTQSTPLNRLAVGTARYLAGLGTLPEAPLPPLGQVPESRHVQVAVVGGGPAGCAVAAATLAAGLRTVVLDATAPADAPSPVVGAARVLGLYDDQALLAITPHGQLRLRADLVVVATGAYEQPPPCPGNDRPGVLGLRAAERALALGILPGLHVAVAVAGDADPSTRRRAACLGEGLVAAGASVTKLGGAGGADTPLPLQRISGAAPRLWVARCGDAEPVVCDALVWAGRPAPAYEMPRQMGIDTPFDAELGGFVPVHGADGSTARDGVFVAGEVAGVEADAAAAHGAAVGAALCRKLRLVDADVSVA
jgi:sarcosine oxidase subunit alpha